MNPILESKRKELEDANDYECWYLVKQPTDFGKLCYLVSFLKEYRTEKTSHNLQAFIGKKIAALHETKPDIEISDNYRALRVAAFFGLITMTSTAYEKAAITETFEEIARRCGSSFEKTALYEDIIRRQIEKMFISSAIDEEHQGVRQAYRLYPVMLLYKVLLELGRSTGKYTVTMTEYRYLVATTKTFAGFLETLMLIKLLRTEDAAGDVFEQYKAKFDNRLIQALKQLDTLTIDKDGIAIKPEYVAEVARKVYIFEENPAVFDTDDYLQFLGSTKTLFALEEFETERQNDFDKAVRIAGGTNTLLYGVPGAGKSYTIENEYCSDDACMERVVFHPDYTYADFVGQILPQVSSDGMVRYAFTPGPFTAILREAYTHPQCEYFLVIEEINRGNAPAIFGEVFQLLDRKTRMRARDDDGYPIGTSEYGITNADIAQAVYKDPHRKVRIPSNLSIIGTMNTSDQNVFTLDTAFQRRWDMRLIENNFAQADQAFAEQVILDTSVTWKAFCMAINEIILENNVHLTSSEDKRLGTYFVQLRDLIYDKAADDESLDTIARAKAGRNNRRFPEKVLKYLWDDAFKFSREEIFEVDRYNSLETIIRRFVQEKGDARFSMFRQNVLDALSGDASEQGFVGQ